MGYQQMSGNMQWGAQLCGTLALSAGYRFFALQYGGECFASNDFGAATQFGTSTGCTMTCASGENCGGPLANNLYEILGLA